MIKHLVFGLSLISAAAFTDPALAGDGRTLQIVVSKDDQSLVVYDGDQVVATSNVSTGKSGHTTPSGIFSILEKEKYHESNIYSNAPMPFMQRITWSGIALHESSSVPRYPASHGCVRMPKAFAKALYGMTERGAHVIITDAPVVPVAFSHPSLFKPRNPILDNQLLSDAELRPATPDPTLRTVELAMNEVLPKMGAAATAVIEDSPPIKILITRRGDRETMLDVQGMLNGLGFDTGIPDGQAGSLTIGAIKAFKQSKNLPSNGKLLSQDFLTAIYDAAGKGRPAEGQILVRQKFIPLFESPVIIENPELPLGTHFIEATDVHRSQGTVEWHALTLPNELSAQTMKRLGITGAMDSQPYDGLAQTLNRITIPDDIRHRIEGLLTDGSSITISDNGMGPDTGAGTDFITITRTNQS